MEMEVTAEDLARDMQHNMIQLSSAPSSRLHREPTIHRVHPSVRRHGADAAYDPALVSIGPLHLNALGLEPAQQLKWSYLQDLLARSPEAELRRYVGAVWAHEEDVRRRYAAGEVGLRWRQFVEVLVLDGCFLVEFLIKRAEGRIAGPLAAAKWNLPLLRRDLLLLENQIPFFVLQVLFDNTPFNPGTVVGEPHRVTINGGAFSLMDLALHYISRGEVKEAELLALNSASEVHHLLHLSHLCLLKEEELGLEEAEPTSRSRRHSKIWIPDDISLPMSLFCAPPSNGPRPRSSGKKKTDRSPRMIPSASELREFGVVFRRNNGRSFLDVSFKAGVIRMPPLFVQDNTESYFRNLIALEQSCPSCGSDFTSFAVLMGNMVNTPADVEMLVGAGILESKLGSREEVARLFNGLCKGVSLDYESHCFAALFRDVSEFCESGGRRLRATLASEYFGNPWAKIAVAAATLLLLLVGVQTAFAVLGYVNPLRLD